MFKLIDDVKLLMLVCCTAGYHLSVCSTLVTFPTQRLCGKENDETPTGRNLNLVAVGDIPEQLRLKYIGHAMRERKGSTQLQCAK